MAEKTQTTARGRTDIVLIDVDAEGVIEALDTLHTVYNIEADRLNEIRWSKHNGIVIALLSIPAAAPEAVYLLTCMLRCVGYAHSQQVSEPFIAARYGADYHDYSIRWEKRGQPLLRSNRKYRFSLQVLDKEAGFVFSINANNADSWVVKFYNDLIAKGGQKHELK